MTQKPGCLVITGRPGSGKTTLNTELSKRLHRPCISRDEIKEGYVNTFGVNHDTLPEETNRVVNQVFFETVLTLLRGNVSIVIEAAFQHRLWDLVMPEIIDTALTCIIVCDSPAEISAKRHLERGLENSDREFYHGDKTVTLFRETGKFALPEEYNPPRYDVPTLCVFTVGGYEPGLEELVRFVKECHKDASKASGQLGVAEDTLEAGCR